jgi:hypothetical protein
MERIYSTHPPVPTPIDPEHLSLLRHSVLLASPNIQAVDLGHASHAVQSCDDYDVRRQSKARGNYPQTLQFWDNWTFI